MIINGKKIEGSPKQAKVVVAGKELDLTLAYTARMKSPKRSSSGSKLPKA